MITPGGEEAFVKKMVDESIMLGQRCRYVPSSIIPYYLRADFADGTPPWLASNHPSRLSLRSSALTPCVLNASHPPSSC